MFLPECDRKGYDTKAEDLYLNVKVIILSSGTLTHSTQLSPKRSSVLKERLPFFQWANSHHQCSPSLEYLLFDGRILTYKSEYMQDVFTSDISKLSL